MIKTCGTCRWHHHEDIDDGYVCVNAKSEKRTDWTDEDYKCDAWEGRDENAICNNTEH